MVAMNRIVNNKVSDGSQPPMMFHLSLSESAGARSLHLLVGRRQLGDESSASESNL